MDGNSEPVSFPAAGRRRVLLRRGLLLEEITLASNVAGLALNAAAGLWWADPLSALVIVFYAVREAREIFLPGPHDSRATAKAQQEEA